MTTTTHTRPDQPNRGTAILAGLLGLALLAPPAHAAPKPNFGLYVENYVMLVPSNAPFLIHPTGDYVGYDDPKQWKKVAYDPVRRDTDDMDKFVLDMRDKGYVMIGYSAFGSNEADTSIQDELRAMSPTERAGFKLGLRMRGIRADADPLGDPGDAARWANAELVVVQKNYAFTRKEIRKDRIVTDDGQDTTRTTGRTRSGHANRQDSQTTGYSDTQGQSDTHGQTDDSHWGVGAKAGYDKGGYVEGSADYGENHGTSASNTQYGEHTNHGESTTAQGRGTSYTDTDDTVSHDTKHWATALIDRHVDHYEYMVTFWKRADPHKVTLGVITEPVRRELWTEIGTRHARAVSAVIGGSPAYLADVWEGDVLLAIDGERIAGEEGLSRLLGLRRGQQVKLTLWRAGRAQDLAVRLNDPGLGQ